MRKILVAGILALVVIGCVLAAGCTTTTNQASGTMTEEGLNGAVVTTSEEVVTTAETPKINVTFHWPNTYFDTGWRGNNEKFVPRYETVEIDQGSDVWFSPLFDNGGNNIFTINYIVNGEEKFIVITSDGAKSMSTADKVVEIGEKLTINEPIDVYINR